MLKEILPFVALLVSLMALLAAWRDRRRTMRRLGEMESLADSLGRKLKQRGRLADELAHEIKNPISAILCSAQALELLIGDKLPPAQRQCLSYIREYGDSLLHLVSDFLDLSRAETNVLKTEICPVHVKAAVEAVLGLLQTSANAKNVRFALRENSPNLWIKADPRHLKQIVFNLLHNAVKFTPVRGEISVELSGSEADAVRIEVSDGGPGIDPENVETIFEPYVHDERRSPQGVGLGLSVAKALVELSGGKIYAGNVVNGGAKFIVELPGSEAPKSELKIKRSAASPLEGSRVLLVEQEPGIRDALAQLIVAWGGLVDHVEEAASALEALSTASYDAVMLDHSRASENGGHALKELAQEARKKSSRLIVAADNRDARRMAESLGAISIEKPLTSEALLESLIGSGKPEGSDRQGR